MPSPSFLGCRNSAYIAGSFFPGSLGRHEARWTAEADEDFEQYHFFLLGKHLKGPGLELVQRAASLNRGGGEGGEKHQRSKIRNTGGQAEERQERRTDTEKGNQLNKWF